MIFVKIPHFPACSPYFFQNGGYEAQISFTIIKKSGEKILPTFLEVCGLVAAAVAVTVAAAAIAAAVAAATATVALLAATAAVAAVAVEATTATAEDEYQNQNPPVIVTVHR